jgi:methylmalonyl-CoA mutase
METGYQRGKIQDESMLYEHRKHDGSLPIIGVNTFLNPNGNKEYDIELARSTDQEKQSQIKRLAEFQASHADTSAEALERVRKAAINNDNIFGELVNAVRHCSLGEITHALFEVGGQYRRNM